ncbi:helix-turn-helix transcriptional regulator [Gordonia sp. SL306]|uniref:helix-turn-helix transcriptional regulator n=1 Tax=Gordonia sp. SL306 TaxID=2995145 RepID=UPI002270AA5C|nr:helix-turn-helix domain-containing protein [Gordonia sp. SL306]WAC55171.1 helix-turn-helix domain-containing protein [Gordonia sp. SL306]
MPTTSTLVSTQELARELGCAKKTVLHYVHNFGLPVHRLGPRVFRYDLDEVHAWLRSNPMPAQGAPSGTPTDADDDYRDSIRKLVDAAPALSADQADRASARFSRAVRRECRGNPHWRAAPGRPATSA